MWTKIAAWWNGLPHGVQAVLAAFGGGFLGVVEPVAESWATGHAVCATPVAACLRAYLVSGVKAGAVAVIFLYVRSSRHS